MMSRRVLSAVAGNPIRQTGHQASLCPEVRSKVKAGSLWQDRDQFHFGQKLFYFSQSKNTHKNLDLFHWSVFTASLVSDCLVTGLFSLVLVRIL